MTYRLLRVLLMSAFLPQLLGCIGYRKRSARLFNEVKAQGQTFDAGIVPGVPFTNNNWDRVMKGRVLWSVILYKQGIIRNVIYSGSAVYSPYYEARIMGLYAQQLGIPAAHIFYETRAEHSTENVFYSYELARKEGFKTLALLTDPFQSSLLKGFTRRRFATTIKHLPFVIDTLKQYNNLDPAINPASAYKENFTSITKRESSWKRLRGTLGAFIPWEKGSGRKAKAL